MRTAISIGGNTDNSEQLAELMNVEKVARGVQRREGGRAKIRESGEGSSCVATTCSPSP
jgi:hypothetical protein